MEKSDIKLFDCEKLSARITKKTCDCNKRVAVATFGKAKTHILDRAHTYHPCLECEGLKE